MFQTCPCCGDSLIRQVRNHSLSWFCRGCWQDMPNFEQTSRLRAPEPVSLRAQMSTNFSAQIGVGS